MKAIFLSLALGLGMILAGDTGGGSTTPRGSTQDLATGTGGGSTTPRGSTQDIA